MGGNREKGAVPKIKSYSGTSPCWLERKGSQVKSSDLRICAWLRGDTHSSGAFSNMRNKLNAQNTRLPSLPSCTSKSGLIYYYYMEVCCAVTHTLRVLQTFSAQSHEFTSCVHWNKTGRCMASFILSPFAFPTKLRKKIALNRNTLSEFGSRSQRKQLNSSREQKPTSEKWRKKQPQTSKNRKSSRKFPYRDLICYCTQILALWVKIYKKLSSLIHHLLPTVL